MERRHTRPYDARAAILSSALNASSLHQLNLSFLRG